MRKTKALTQIMLYIQLSFTAQSHISIHGKKVTLTFSAAGIEDILKSITDQSGATFQFSNNNIDPNKKININLINGTVKNALDLVFKGTDIHYTEYQNQILLRKS